MGGGGLHFHPDILQRYNPYGVLAHRPSFIAYRSSCHVSSTIVIASTPKADEATLLIMPRQFTGCHCEERSDEATSLIMSRQFNDCHCERSEATRIVIASVAKQHGLSLRA